MTSIVDADFNSVNANSNTTTHCLGAATPYDGTFVDAEPIPRLTILSIGAEAVGDLVLTESSFFMLTFCVHARGLDQPTQSERCILSIPNSLCS